MQRRQISHKFNYVPWAMSILFMVSPLWAAIDGTLTVTFNSVGIEVNSTAASGTLHFKKSSDSTWRNGLPLWQAGSKLYGSVLLCAAGTSYDIEVTPAGGAAQTGSVTTRVDNIPAASSLTPTHTIPGSYATLDQALQNAPSGAIVRLAPGYYTSPTVNRTTPIALVAQYPAVDDNRNIINTGQHSVIDSGSVAPPNSGKWVQVTPDGNAAHPVWQWANSGTYDSKGVGVQMGYAATRDVLPKRIPHWSKPDTIADWATLLYANPDLNWGFKDSGQDMYVRLPGGANPNNYYITVGAGDGLAFSGSSIRISGLEVRNFDDAIVFDGNFAVVDHCLISGSGNGIGFHGGADHVAQYNRIVDSNLWSNDPQNPAIPWDFIKSNFDVYYRVGQYNETGAGYALAKRCVWRYNTIDGPFNGIGSGYNQGLDRYASQDMDIHDNLFIHISDDSMEPEFQCINMRAWNNRYEYISTVLSVGPLNYGPVFLFRNTAWRVGDTGVGAMANGDKGVGTVCFKYSGSSSPTGRVFVLHNTFWSDVAGSEGGAQYASGGPGTEAFYLRNNIFYAMRYAFQTPIVPVTDGKWNEDYDYFSANDTTRGLRFNGTVYTTNVAGYRTASQGGAHTNVSGNFITAPQLQSPTNGNLNLPNGSALIDAGVQVPNISDQASLFNGAAPDIGSSETGSGGGTSTPLSAPKNLRIK